MNNTIKMLLIFVSFIGFGAVASAAEYECANYGDFVCAKNLSTGQCTHSWDNEDGGNPMFFCEKFIGKQTSSASKSNMYCKDMGDFVCAKNLSTGQCAQTWADEDGAPMFRCEKYLNGSSGSSNGHDGYVCKNTGDGYCAKNLSTGQCTHYWLNEDGGDAQFFCNKWVNG